MKNPVFCSKCNAVVTRESQLLCGCIPIPRQMPVRHTQVPEEKEPEEKHFDR